MTQTFTLECPNCGEDFEHKADPVIAFVDEGPPIICPHCAEEIEWEYPGPDATTPVLSLIPDEEEDEEEEEDDFTDDDDEDEEDDDE